MGMNLAKALARAGMIIQKQEIMRKEGETIKAGIRELFVNTFRMTYTIPILICKI